MYLGQNGPVFRLLINGHDTLPTNSTMASAAGEGWMHAREERSVEGGWRKTGAGRADPSVAGAQRYGRRAGADGSPLPCALRSRFAAIPLPFAPALLPRFHEEPWSHQPPEDEVSALLLACMVVSAVPARAVIPYAVCCPPFRPRLQEALLAAEELAWDKKMSALRQPASKGQPSGNLQVEQTEEDPEVSKSVLFLTAPSFSVRPRVLVAASNCVALCTAI